MSFRNRFFASSTANGGANTSNAGAELRHSSSFSARESRKSLTRQEFQKSVRQISLPQASASFKESSTSAKGLHVADEEAEKHLGFVFSRTSRQAYDEITLLLRTCSDSAEDAVSALFGLSALSEADLIRTTDIDSGVWKQLLNHEVNTVRCAACRVGSQVANRIWDWFSLVGVFESFEDFESSEQDVRNYVVQLWRAIADRYTDADEAVASACFEALDEMASDSRQVLFERVARYLLPSAHQVANRATLIRTTAATRFATKLLLFALDEVRPHVLSLSTSNSLVPPSSIAASVQSFVEFHLLPSMDGSEALNGDVSLTAAEQALLLSSRYHGYTAYEATRIKVACANAALLQLRALDANSLVLPDSTRHQRKQRCARVLFESAHESGHLRHRQRVRVLGRCIAICVSYPTAKDLLRESCEAVIEAELDGGEEESAIEALLLREGSVLKAVWNGPEKARHRLAYFLFSAVNQLWISTSAVSSIEKKKARTSKTMITDLAVRILESCHDCLKWGDSSFQNHAAGHAYAELVGQTLAMTSNDSPTLERFVRSSIEWRLELPTSPSIKLRLLWLYSRALCSFVNPDAALGQKLVQHVTALAMAHIPERVPGADDDDNLLNDQGGTSQKDEFSSRSLFIVCVSILSHLAKHLGAPLRNAVASAMGQMSTKSSQLSPYEKLFLENRIGEMEKPRSATTATGDVKKKMSSSSESPRARGRGSIPSLDLGALGNEGEVFPLREGERLTTMMTKRVYERQLSGGNDPMYVLGSIARGAVDASLLTCTVKVFNISNCSIGSVLIRVACHGDVRLDLGETGVFRFNDTLPPGGFAQVKFALSRVSDDYRTVFSLASKRGLDIFIDYADVSYALPSWTIPLGVFIHPKPMSVETFRYLWGRKTGSSAKCEAHILTLQPLNPETGFPHELGEKLFHKATRGSAFHLVAWSNRTAMMAAMVDDSLEEVVLLTCQLGDEGRLALDLRSSEKNLLVGFDFREALTEIVFPQLDSIQCRVVWSGRSNWAGSLQMTQRPVIDPMADDVAVPHSMWAVNCEEVPGLVGGAGEQKTGRALYVNALQRWINARDLKDRE